MSDTSPRDPASGIPPEVFRQAVEQAALAISITDAQARILYCNPAFQRVTGYVTGEVAGRNESILSDKVTPRLVYETLWAQILRQRPWNGLLVNRRKDGSRYLAELTITPVVAGDGKTSHYLGMHRDVTEVHRLERQVQNQKALIESVVDAAPVAIVLLDEMERVILDNQEYKKLIGDLGPEPAATLLAVLHANLGEALGPGHARGFGGEEVHVHNPAGRSLWFACSGSWIDEQDDSADAFYEPARRRYLLMVIQDISAHKEQQEAIRVTALRAMLAEQERIQGMRETLSGALYQLQAPFNLLAAGVRLLARQGGDASLVASLAEALDKGNGTLESLRNCIPCQADEAITAVDLNGLLRDLLRLATPRLLADGITVEWSPGELPQVSGRPTRLATLFKALLDNAIEAIHDGRGERRDIRLATTARPGWVEVAIEDSGPGIPDEWRYKVFEPFFTTKGADRQHIGMGLSAAQEVVIGHGGLIELGSAAGGGCRACVQLPTD